MTLSEGSLFSRASPPQLQPTTGSTQLRTTEMKLFQLHGPTKQAIPLLCKWEKDVKLNCWIHKTLTDKIKKLILNTVDVQEEHIAITEILKNHFTTAKRFKKCRSISI